MLPRITNQGRGPLPGSRKSSWCRKGPAQRQGSRRRLVRTVEDQYHQRHQTGQEQAGNRGRQPMV